MKEPKASTTYVVTLSVVLMGVWLAWSGIYESLLISFGLISVALTVFVSRSLAAVDNEGQPMSLGVRPFWYIPWLLKEIIVANIDVIKRILHPKLKVYGVVENQ